ncbi:MAG: cytochrome c3 family protein, partial [Desulfobulbaceae bacterium]|nr:cytochrome c3 family protein [Desulfobulbaceae bacterium]
MKTRLLLAGSVAVFCLSFGTAYTAEVDIGPDSITMKSIQSKKPAKFPHRFHQDFMACMKCHHTKDRTMTIEKCYKCHNQDIGNEKLDTLKEVGHTLCKDCHKAARKAGKNAPGKCSTCHPLEIRKKT